MSRTRPAIAAGALLTVLLLAGCGGSDDGGGASSSADLSTQSQLGDSGAKGAAEPGAVDGGDAAVSTEGRDQAAAPAVGEQKIIRTAAMTVQTKNVDTAASAVRAAVEQAKGYISEEKTSTTPDDPGNPEVTTSKSYTQSMLTARVPNESLDRVMLEVGRTGTVLARGSSSADVTDKYVDTQSRVRSQTASVVRVRALLAKATSLGQVVQIEGELARREADLESLQAQLKSLEDQTTLSTLTINLTPTNAPVPPSEDDEGFLAGLAAGWSALLASLTVVLTVLGALLPFLVLLGLVAIPVVVWARRQRSGSSTPPDPTQSQPPNQPQPQPAP